MRLLSLDGTEVSLTLDAYQFPGREVDWNDWGEPDHDANWLMVTGSVTLPDRRTHQFTDPCLLTWEANRIAPWLREQAQRPVDAGAKLEWLWFLEPCVAFGAAPLSVESVELRLYLSLEAEPPFVIAGAAGIVENYVPLLMNRPAIEEAAFAWEREITAFPLRGVGPQVFGPDGRAHVE